MKKLTRLIIPALVALLVSGPAWAAKDDHSINNFLQVYDKSDAKFKTKVRDALVSMVTGMEIINSDLKSKGRPQMFCLNELTKNLTITGEQYFFIFKKYVKKHDKAREAPAGGTGIILYLALQEAFPCK
jgi:hypothetical protein